MNQANEQILDAHPIMTTRKTFTANINSNIFDVANTSDLTKLLEPVQTEIQLVEKWLKTNLIDESPFIGELLEQVFLAGGKRLRPALVLLSSKATLQKNSDLGRLHIVLAVLTELIHTASLVHDDVIDKASLRRGNRTINNRFDDRLAVLLGDLLFAQASICLARLMNPVIVGIYGRVLGDLCAGEISQMKQQFSSTVNWDAYIAKSIAKTASLFAAGCHSGAILNGCANEIVQALQNYGLKLGLCFQIIDDLLDVTGTSDQLGKEPGSDLRSGTITAPALFVLERQDKASEKLRKLINNRVICTEDGSQEALTIIHQNGGVDETVKLAGQLAKESTSSLSALPKSQCRDNLYDVVDYVLQRVN
jgi:all-trans-nonaprenyl-diphosphate synthase